MQNEYVNNFLTNNDLLSNPVTIEPQIVIKRAKYKDLKSAISLDGTQHMVYKVTYYQTTVIDNDYLMSKKEERDRGYEGHIYLFDTFYILVRKTGEVSLINSNSLNDYARYECQATRIGKDILNFESIMAMKCSSLLYDAEADTSLRVTSRSP